MEFLNVDLEIRSATDPWTALQPIARSLFVLHRGRVGRRHRLLLELSGQPTDPGAAILAYARLIQRLRTRNPKALARAALEFDVGIQSSRRKYSREWVLDPRAVRAAARLGAAIRLTVYAPARRR